MPSFEQDMSETTTPTQVEGGNALVGEVDAESADPITVRETPTSAAARMLELAGVTADRLVIEAEAEAEALVTGAQARADAILEASRNEARQVAAELARERGTALAELRDEKSALEAQNAKLRQVASDHRTLMRHHLTEQLSMLDATLPDPPAVSPG
jgi:vacuolar-type H+-ATPase subunit H